MTYKPGHTVRSVCHRYRLTYSPDWCQVKPWCSYRNGTAGLQFATLEEGIAYFKSEGAKFGEGAKP